MLPEILVLFALPFLAIGYILAGIWEGGVWLVKVVRSARDRRRERIEAELDRQQDAMLRSILSVAESLSGNAHEARRALLRESYRAAEHKSADH